MHNKCRYNRKSYSNDEIVRFVEMQRILDRTRKYSSPLSGKDLDTEYKWKNDIVRHMDVSSANLFFYLLENDIPKCAECQKTLEITQYSYGARQLGFKGFKKYCYTCENTEVWKSHVKSEQSRNNIRDGLKSWSNTPEGKQYYKLRGKSNSEFMKQFGKTEIGKLVRNQSNKKQSVTMRKRIADGLFTPNITNSWTHWDANIEVDGIIKKYRSSWEACFAICHPECKYEFLRIPYGNNQTYIGDFYDEMNCILYEIKPRKTYNLQVVKMTAAIEYCKLHGIKFVWVNEMNILKYVVPSQIVGYNRMQYEKMIKGLTNANIKN